MKGRFVEAPTPKAIRQSQWEPAVFRSGEIDEEIGRLAASVAPDDGRREAIFAHPSSSTPGIGLAPGIRVTLCVLEPGERTAPIRHNSTMVQFCIRGGGTAVVGDQQIEFEPYDVWNIPSYTTYWHINDTPDRQVRLSYSNAPLLEKMGVHIVEETPQLAADPDAALDDRDELGDAAAGRHPFGTFELNESRAMLMPYELLIAPPPVESPVLHWPWKEVKHHLDQLDALGSEYGGRRLYLLYNPMTGRTNGTTPSFFATITIRPPGIVDRPHRHVSAAINYFFHGTGSSRVAGRRYTWEAGDLMFTAPGWAIHNHASDDGSPVYELTIQDQPLHIATESLLWQEDLKHSAVLLGSQPGFATNRAQVLG